MREKIACDRWATGTVKQTVFPPLLPKVALLPVERSCRQVTVTVKLPVGVTPFLID